MRLRGKDASSGERWLPEFGDTHECWRGSHPAVTRSLLMGLTALGHTVQFNPQAVLAREVRVGCLASPQAAAHLLRLREAGEVDRLLIGPNTHVSPLECGSVEKLLGADAILCPSDWVVRFAQDLAEGAPLPLKVWASGTDTDFWRPSGGFKKRTQVLLYVKTDSDSLVAKTLESLESFGRDVLTLVYGKHDRYTYRDALNQCSEVVYLGGGESQGLALQEAWSMDCRTLVYLPDSVEVRFPSQNPPMRLHRGQFSAAPYLTSQCGNLWETQQQLATLLNDGVIGELRPRTWVLENMTLEHSARNYFQLLLGE